MKDERRKKIKFFLQTFNYDGFQAKDVTAILDFLRAHPIAKSQSECECKCKCKHKYTLQSVQN